MELEAAYQTYRPLLQSIAYRMIGSVTEAEDIVHDLFLNYNRLPLEDVNNMKAYLIKAVTNRSLNYLESARKKREVYAGMWLPEPLADSRGDNPAEKLVREETLSYALLVVLEQLTPVERAVFILREALAYDYRDIAACLDKSEANCRKIFSRAKQKVQQESAYPPKAVGWEEPLVAKFLQAANTGDFHEVIDLLTEDAVLMSDGGGKVRAALRPIQTRARVFAFLQGIATKGSFAGENRLAAINGEPAIADTRRRAA